MLIFDDLLNDQAKKLARIYVLVVKSFRINVLVSKLSFFSYFKDIADADLQKLVHFY